MPSIQSTSLAGTIYAKVIEQLIIAYQYDDLTITPYFRYKTIATDATNTAGFPRWVKSAGPVAGTPATETTALATTDFTTTTVDIAVSRVGIAREVTDTVLEDSVIGRALDVSGLVADAARLYGEYFDTASAALFPSVTASVGTTATVMSIATMVALVASQRTNKAKGPLVISLHDHQLKQLQQAQAAATATPWQVFFNPTADGGQFGGYFMNAPVWASGLNPTANAAADRVGACWVDGQARPEFCAFGFVVKRVPSSKTETNVLSDSNIWASFARTGCGVVANNFATKVISTNA